MFCLNSFALEVDEKLTGRVLKASDSRKTILINRGTEDGLTEGDHAKFFVSAGVVARGVCIKVAPSRSVWSIYRLVNADFISQDSVMNLKITPPVKLTKDESKMIVQDDTPSATTDGPALGIPLAEGANDLPPGGLQGGGAGGMSQQDLLALSQQLGSGKITEKNYEAWGSLNFINVNSKTSSGSGGYSGNNTYTQLTVAGEYYFKDEKQWYSKFSFYPFVNILNRGILNFSGGNATTQTMDFGGGVSFHPWKLPSHTNDFIPFFTLSTFMGTTKSSYKPGNDNQTGAVEESTGKSSGYSFGGGVKFYTNKGYGFRAILDFYTRKDIFGKNVYGEEWSQTSSGPRLYMGVSYRF